MYHDTQPAPLHDDGSDPWSQFRVGHASEILGLLRQLRDGSTPLVASAPDGASVGTDIWSLDDRGGRMTLGADENNPTLPALLAADEAVAVGYLDSVKLQFDLHDLMLVRGARSASLQARIPDVMYRFQRRGAFRVRTNGGHAPVVHLRHPAIPDMPLALRVVDVSIGGCSLHLPHDVPQLAPGVRVHSVRIELDAETRFFAALQIQHIGSLQAGDGGLRIGCEWIELDRESERALQRYIDQAQKRRRLLTL